MEEEPQAGPSHTRELVQAVSLQGPRIGEGISSPENTL